MVSRGLLQCDDGLCIAKTVTLAMNAPPDAPGISDIRATLSVHDDPMFARRNLRKRFIFVSAFDPGQRIEIFVIDAGGACIAFPREDRS